MRLIGLSLEEISKNIFINGTLRAHDATVVTLTKNVNSGVQK